ncbi:MAG: putative metalloprotease with PDZ domain [Myxococcota bacterium]|jgi:predicted metalloprotease with PDZ domain
MGLMNAPITYQVTPSHPGAHLFTVSVTVAQPAAVQVFTLPTWIPGSYMIREFSQHIVQISGADSTGPVAVTKVDKRAWSVTGAAGPLILTYEIYAWDLSVRKAHLDQTHGFFNGTSLFLSPEGFADQPHAVTLHAPTDPKCVGWKVATTLPRVSGGQHDFGNFLAADYDALVDHPVEMGTFDLAGFEVAGVHHEFAVTGTHSGDLDLLAADSQAICSVFSEMFGGLPMERYLFQLTVETNGYGGLEHRDSTALIHPRSGLPQTDQTERSDDYINLLGLISHEYFHLWNIKRIKPEAYLPYDLSTEGYTTQLWAFEGITSYFDDLCLLRAGLISTEQYLTLIGKSATRVFTASGRFKQSVTDSSFDAWVKLYRSNENSTNATISYYTKGALIALALDLTLRQRSDGRVCLDDVMRTLWARHGKPGIGVPEDGVEKIAAELLGEDLTGFFDLALRGTTDLPMADILAGFAVSLKRRPMESTTDKGGKASSKDVEVLRSRGSLSIRAKSAEGGSKVTTVLDGGAAQDAGLSAGDVVIAVDGLKCGGKLIATCADRKPGETLTLHAFRRGVLMTFEVTLKAPPESVVYFELLEDAPEAALARRKAWLGA